MRLSRSLETEETRRLQAELLQYHKRTQIWITLVTIIPSLVILLTNDVDHPAPKHPLLILAMFALLGLGLYLQIQQSRGLKAFDLPFPALDESDILYEDHCLPPAPRLIILADEIWYKADEKNFLTPFYGLEARIAKRDIIGLYRRPRFRNHVWQIEYRTSKGTKSLRLNPTRLEGMKEALYTNLHLAQVPA